MRFIIKDGKPYLCSGGRVYPCEITDGTVRIEPEQGEISGDLGDYSLREVTAKLGNHVSSIRRKRKKSEV